MKKIILSAAVCMMATACFAQKSSFDQLTYGVKAGLNFANVTNSEADTKTSFYIGGFVDYKLSDLIVLSPELVYSRQGYKYEEQDEKIHERMNYINIPLLVKFCVVDNLTVDLGPQVGFLAGATEVWEYDGDKEKESVSDYYKTVDLSFAIGATYGFGKFFAQTRYNIGLTDIEKENDSNTKFKNSVFQLGAGYRF